MVLLLPRVGLLAAGELVRVPSAAELDSQRAGADASCWRRRARGARALGARRREVTAQPEATRTAYEDENLWRWMQEDDELRQKTLAEIDAYRARLEERARNLRRRQERLALGIAGWTPPAAFRAVAVTVAETGADLGARYTAAIEAYREDVRRFLLEKDRQRAR